MRANIGFRSNNGFIAYPRLQDAYREIDDLRCTGRNDEGANCQLLTGPTGVGKSVLIRQYVSAFPMRSEPERDVRPVVLVQTPDRGRSKWIAEALLRQLGDPKPTQGTEEDMKGRVYHLLQEQRTELVIFDEVQHVARRDLYEAADFFKGLLNNGGCPILLAGLPDAIDLLRANDQLDRRSRPMIRLPAFDWFDEGDREIFRSLLKTLERLRAKEIAPCGLASLPVAVRMHLASGGVFGRVTQLQDRVAQLNRMTGEMGTTLDLLARAYEEFAQQKPHDYPRENPFRIRELPDHWQPAAFDAGVRPTLVGQRKTGGSRARRAA